MHKIECVNLVKLNTLSVTSYSLLYARINSTFPLKQHNVTISNKNDKKHFLLISSCVIERETMSLHPIYIEYIEGARLYLETETDKDNTSIREVKKHFCDFIRIMIKSFSCKYLFNYVDTWKKKKYHNNNKHFIYRIFPL